MNYSNPWSGKRQFYKGKRKKLPTAETDREYKAYCKAYEKRNGNLDNAMSYKAWYTHERKRGMF